MLRVVFNFFSQTTHFRGRLIAAILIFAASVSLASFGLPVPGTEPALAASFTCAKAATTIELAICADPAVSVLDEQLSTEFTAALALSLDPTAFRADEADWLQHQRAYAASNGTLAVAYADRVKALSGDVTKWRQRLPDLVEPEAAAKTTCLAALADPDDASAPCAPEAFDALGNVDGKPLFAARYRYSPDGDLDYARAVIFQQLPSGMLEAVRAPDPDPAFLYDKPELLQSGGRTMLEIPITEDGTGNFNREHLYVWRDGAWFDVDTTSWLADLARRLPKGIGALQGIFPDYATLKGSTLLWHVATDGNACPSAGRADLTLGWRGDTLILKTITRRPAGDCGDSSSG